MLSGDRTFRAMNFERQLLTTREAAERLGLSPRTLEAWRLDEHGAPLRAVKIGRAVRYRVADVDKLIRGDDRGGAEIVPVAARSLTGAGA